MYPGQVCNLLAGTQIPVSLGFERNQKIFLQQKQDDITTKTRFGETLAYLKARYAETKNTHCTLTSNFLSTSIHPKIMFLTYPCK